MKIIKCLKKEEYKNLRAELGSGYSGCVTALGFFDGVHLAHRRLLSEAKALAEGAGLPLAVFTFIGDNGKIKSGSPRLYKDEQKLKLLSECRADIAILCDFDAVSDLTEEQFVGELLISSLETRVAVCGFNFRFGKGAVAGAADLERLMRECGGSATVIPEFIYDGEAVSSTRIRALLEGADMRSAGLLLGKPYFLFGKVSHGNGMGTSLGIPTVNTDIDKALFSPPRGVYASVCEVGGSLFPSLTNVGLCPTFGERALHAETFILDFDGNLYGTDLRVYLLDFLREEKVFSDEKELIKQINVDIERAKSLLKEIKWQEIGLSLQ